MLDQITYGKVSDTPGLKIDERLMAKTEVSASINFHVNNKGMQKTT